MYIDLFLPTTSRIGMDGVGRLAIMGRIQPSSSRLARKHPFRVTWLDRRIPVAANVGFHKPPLIRLGWSESRHPWIICCPLLRLDAEPTSVLSPEEILPSCNPCTSSASAPLGWSYDAQCTHSSDVRKHPTGRLFGFRPIRWMNNSARFCGRGSKIVMSSMPQ
jgi:hypothetical protein